jgi:lipoate-protein ligase A
MTESLNISPGIECATSATDAAQAQRWANSALSEVVQKPNILIWRSVRPTLVLGRAQKIDPALRSRAKSREVDLCNRLTGGGAVLAGPWLLCASIVLPLHHVLVSPHIVDSFQWLGKVHADWLRSFGIRANCAARGMQVPDPSLEWACFGNISSWEVEAEAGKIVGLAQARSHNGVLLQSATLVEPTPWALLCEIMGQRPGLEMALSRRTSSCAQFTHAPPAIANMATALARSLEVATLA